MTYIYNPFKTQDIPIAPENPSDNTRFGSNTLRAVKEFQVGTDVTSFNANESGIWLGAKKFANAPFKVDMYGNLTATLATITGLVVGTNVGIGTAQTAGQVTTIIGNTITTGYISALGLQVGTQIGLGTAQSASQVTTIIGNTVTTGFVNALSITAGSVAAENITGTTISGKTITGSTLTTASSGQRVVLTSTLAQFYNSSNTLIAQTYASGSSYLIKGSQNDSSVYLDSGYSGTISFASNGSLIANMSGSLSTFSPASNGGLDLGKSDYQWNYLYLLSQFVFRGIYQPVTYCGYVIGTGNYNANNSFSISNPSTGNYTITHNFGTTSYSTQATALRASGSGAYIAKITAQNSNTLDITTFNDAGSAVACDFMYAIFKI